jgi:P-type Mg2+ transporter
VFDFLTFGVLATLRVPVAQFRTGWFTESVLSELLILLIIRTRRSFLHSAVGRALLVVSLAVGLATLLLPYSPFASSLGLEPPPWTMAIAIAGILGGYVLTSELAKRFFFGHLHHP